jgi:hypothetical protein
MSRLAASADHHSVRAARFVVKNALLDMLGCHSRKGSEW